MIARTRIHIISAGICHLLLAVCSLPIGLQAQTLPQDAQERHAPADVTMTSSAPLPATPATQPGEPITIKAQEQEKVGPIYHLRGDVEVTFRTYVLHAGWVTYNSDSGEITAGGNVVFDGGPHDEHMTASHGTYNVNTDSGRFYDVIGTTGVKPRGVGVVITSSNPFSFRGAVVDKVGRDTIIVHHGIVTSCTLPQPKWSFHANRVNVVAGEDAKIYNSTFWLWRAPIMYFPFVDHPVEHLARKTGFLMPSYGNSSVKGTILGEAFYWKIDRSTDATIGAEYYSKRGWAQHGEFRKILSNNGYLTARYFGVLDRGVPTEQTVFDPLLNRAVTLPASQDQGGEEIRLNGVTFLRPGVRAVADLDYLSSYLFRAAFAETFAAISSEVRSTAFTSDNWRGYSFGAMASRYQSFQSTTPDDVITIQHTPSLEASSPDRQIGNSRLHWAFDTSAGGLSRQQPGSTTGAVGRMDFSPSLSLPLLWHGWTFRPELAARDTWYSDRNLPVGPVSEPIGPSVNRHALEGWVELRPPALDRIFDHPIFSHQLKHTIEPRIIYHYTTGVDNFQDILLFDDRDVLSNTNEVEYALVSRLYAKNVKNKNCEVTASAAAATPEKAGSSASGGSSRLASKPAADGSAGNECPPASEIASWEVAQKYFFDPTFGGAVVAGRRNVFTTTEDLTGIAFITGPRYSSPIVSRVRIHAPNTDIEWHLDYDPKLGGINSSAAFVNYKLLGDLTIGSGQFFLRSPGEVVTGTAAAPVVVASPSKFNQFRVLANYGRPTKPGFAAGATIGFDAVLHTMQYSAVQANYNWDCCGLTFEYRRYNLGIRDENVFRFALSLVNVGTFGTLRKPERLY